MTLLRWLRDRSLRRQARAMIRATAPLESYLDWVRAEYRRRLSATDQDLLLHQPGTLGEIFDPTVEQQQGQPLPGDHPPTRPSALAGLQTPHGHAADHLISNTVQALYLLQQSQHLADQRRQLIGRRLDLEGEQEDQRDEDRRRATAGLMVRSTEPFPAALNPDSTRWKAPIPWYRWADLPEYLIATLFLVGESVAISPAIFGTLLGLDTSDWAHLWQTQPLTVVMGCISTLSITAVLMGLGYGAVSCFRGIWQQSAPGPRRRNAVGTCLLFSVLIGLSYGLSVLRADQAAVSAETFLDSGDDWNPEPSDHQQGLYIALFTALTALCPLCIATFHQQRHAHPPSPSRSRNQARCEAWNTEYQEQQRTLRQLRRKWALNQIALARRERLAAERERQLRLLNRQLAQLDARGTTLRQAGSAAERDLTARRERSRHLRSQLETELSLARRIYETVARAEGRPDLLHPTPDLPPAQPTDHTEALLHRLQRLNHALKSPSSEEVPHDSPSAPSS